MDFTKIPSRFVADAKNSALVKYKGIVELEYVDKEMLTHDTYLFRFALPERNLVLGTNVANNVRFNSIIPTYEFPEGELVRKKYTPTSPINQQGVVDFPIKIYRAGTNPDFPYGGKMTTFLENLKPGDKITADGPYKRYQYFGNNLFKANEFVNVKHMGFVAGGTGITPFYPIIKNALENGDDVKINLLY